tara:strand:+ start:2306 stop:2800 length:495 start_codon:yes stop_codon:yes gene_type:complete
MSLVEDVEPNSPDTIKDDKVEVVNGTIVDIQVGIADLAAFNRYVIREHSYKLQSPLNSGNKFSESCVTNCIYDELSGWLDNPCLLGFTILDINVSRDKIKEEQVQLNLNGNTFEVGTFELIKFIGGLAGKEHENTDDVKVSSEDKLQAIRQKARDLLKNLVRIN